MPPLPIPKIRLTMCQAIKLAEWLRAKEHEIKDGRWRQEALSIAAATALGFEISVKTVAAILKDLGILSPPAIKAAGDRATNLELTKRLVALETQMKKLMDSLGVSTV